MIFECFLKVPTIQKPVHGIVEQNEYLETAGNFEKDIIPYS